MSEATPRLRLPFILPGQAQKEVFHNEALTILDIGLHAAVEEAGVEVPPATPSEGQCWALGAVPAGAWTGKAHQLAMWTEAGWRFLVPPEGCLVWVKAEGLVRRWTGVEWNGQVAAEGFAINGLQIIGERQPAVPSPSGGTVIDAEARTAINLLIATLISHGLTE